MMTATTARPRATNPVQKLTLNVREEFSREASLASSLPTDVTMAFENGTSTSVRNTLLFVVVDLNSLEVS